MNLSTLEPATCNLEPSTSSLPPAARNPEATADPEPAPCTLHPATLIAHRGNGKVARLSKPLRDQINHWLLEGVSYPEIIERLGEHGKDLKPDNLSQWKKRGHQDWLLEQNWLAQTRARQEPASDLSVDFDATQLNHAALQLGTLQMFEVLRDLSSPRPAKQAVPPRPSDATAAGREGGTPNQDDPVEQTQSRQSRTILDLKLGGDSAAFVRLINALVRASRETMLVQKYRDACTRARTAHRELDPNRKLDERETRAIVRKVDEILGFTSPEDEEPQPRKDELREAPLPAPIPLTELMPTNPDSRETEALPQFQMPLPSPTPQPPCHCPADPSSVF